MCCWLKKKETRYIQIRMHLDPEHLSTSKEHDLNFGFFEQLFAAALKKE
jgi:hypothetical protein